MSLIKGGRDLPTGKGGREEARGGSKGGEGAQGGAEGTVHNVLFVHYGAPVSTKKWCFF